MRSERLAASRRPGLLLLRGRGGPLTAAPRRAARGSGGLECPPPSPLTGSLLFVPLSPPVLPPPPPPNTPLLSAAVPGVSLPAGGAGARGPGVQPAAVECLFSKDSEIKKVEFTDSPESRKEAASSKLFPRQHPGATGKAGSEVQAARRAPASGPGLRVRRRQARPPGATCLLLDLDTWPLGGTGSSRPRDVNSFLQIILHS